MNKGHSDFWRDELGAAAVKMALVTPLLVTILFGTFEAGHYFWNEHVVVKAVRDGARFAARQPLAKINCSAKDATVESNIILLTRTGQISDANAIPKVRNWLASDVTVTIACNATNNTGIYNNVASGAPIVTVSANVDYPSLFEALGIIDSTAKLNARSSAAVVGI